MVSWWQNCIRDGFAARGYGEKNIYIYAIDPLICFDQNVDSTSAVEWYKEFISQIGYEQGYAERLTNNIENEVNLIYTPIVEGLSSSQVMFFKAGKTIEADLDDLNRIVQKPEQLSIIDIADKDHWQILEAVEIISSKIYEAQNKPSRQEFRDEKVSVLTDLGE